MAIELPDDLVIANLGIEVGHSGPEGSRGSAPVHGVEVPVGRATAGEREVAVAEQVVAASHEPFTTADGFIQGAGESAPKRVDELLPARRINHEAGSPADEMCAHRRPGSRPVAALHGPDGVLHLRRQRDQSPPQVAAPPRGAAAHVTERFGCHQRLFPAPKTELARARLRQAVDDALHWTNFDKSRDCMGPTWCARHAPQKCRRCQAEVWNGRAIHAVGFPLLGSGGV